MRKRPQQRPYGLWKSPIRAPEMIDRLRLTDLAWDDHSGRLLWREECSGMGNLLAWEEGGILDLSGSLGVEARLGYGGGDFGVGGGCIVCVSQGRLWLLRPGEGPPQALTPAWGEAAAPAVSPDGRKVLYIHSAEDEDVLAVAHINESGWPQAVHQGHDFYMHPCWHPDGKQVAWISWDHPCMPWEKSHLYVARYDVQRRRLRQIRRIEQPQEEAAVFQPSFSPNGRYLSYVSDVSGWWNLVVLDLTTGKEAWRLEDEAEYGLPAWVHGLRTYAWSPQGDALYCQRLQEGRVQVVRVTPEGGRKSVEELNSEYTCFSQIAVSSRGEVAVIASSPTCPPRIVTWIPGASPRVLRRSAPETLPQTYLSEPEFLHWPSPVESPQPFPCHALYFPPRNPDFWAEGAPPAVIAIHGGPTSQFLADYDPEIQFLTSRGFAVLALNHRGSSGYGKAYLNLLREEWGKADVEDVVSAREFLNMTGRGDPARVVLLGGSAGGFTTLLALLHYPTLFKAGICRYPVTDLFHLVRETHKFEARYLDSLIGPLPERADLYRQRSPISHLEKLRVPVAIFQGDQDPVVPREQVDRLVEELRRRGIPFHYRVLPGEGHGFRKRENLQIYFEDLERFLREQVVLA